MPFRHLGPRRISNAIDQYGRTDFRFHFARLYLVLNKTWSELLRKTGVISLGSFLLVPQLARVTMPRRSRHWGAPLSSKLCFVDIAPTAIARALNLVIVSLHVSAGLPLTHPCSIREGLWLNHCSILRPSSVASQHRRGIVFSTSSGLTF